MTLIKKSPLEYITESFLKLHPRTSPENQMFARQAIYLIKKALGETVTGPTTLRDNELTKFIKVATSGNITPSCYSTRQLSLVKRMLQRYLHVTVDAITL